MSKLNKFQKSAVIICILPFLAIGVAQLTLGYRYSEYRFIYQIGGMLMWSLWFISFIWGLTNAIFILQIKSQKLKTRTIWAGISLLPLLYFVIMSAIVVFGEPLSESDRLPSGEYIESEKFK